MKTASIPSLRVDPKLRSSLESVLDDGETLSGFVEQAIRASIEHRQAQREFITRGLLARDRAVLSGNHSDAVTVVNRLEAMLGEAKAAAQNPR